ncbi:hypothetical protein Tco_1145774 [Tanacetum coccineum]
MKKIVIDKSKSFLAAPKHRECYEGLKKSYDLDKTIFSTYGKVYSLKRSQKDKDKDEEPSTGSDQGLKKRKNNKDAEPTKGLKAKESQSGSSKGDKYRSKSFGKSVQSEEPEFEVANSDIPQDQEDNPGPSSRLLKGTHSNYAELEYDFEKCYKALSEKLDWENPKGGDYLFDLTKPLPLVMSRNCQKVPADYFFNNDLKDQRKSFYGYARGLESRHDVYSTKHILAVTQVEVMRKHGYGYLKEIVVRRADNDLYTFKEGDFPCLHINDIEDMLLLVVQNRLINLSGDDVSNFTISLRMFTRSLVIQKQIEDLQLGVESYQKKINVTKPETTKSGIRKRDPYTPYQDPQGFIYVDTLGQNRLMRPDELYKFSDRTLTGLRTSLDDITKNIRMEYLPKRRWSTLEKKRANIMIKAIDKHLKERRMMRSLEKFVGGRHYETDLRLLQRII